MLELSPARLHLLRIVSVLALLLLVPGLFVGGAQPVAVGLIPVPWDKVAHCVLFSGFAGLIGLSAGLLPLRRSGLLVLAFAGALAIGIADELHQATLPGRQAGWDDLAADAVGALIGTWVLARLGWAR